MVVSYSYQCLNTEISTQSNKGYTTKTLSISYIIYVINLDPLSWIKAQLLY